MQFYNQVLISSYGTPESLPTPSTPANEHRRHHSQQGTQQSEAKRGVGESPNRALRGTGHEVQLSQTLLIRSMMHHEYL
jgi:hypothetical protein